MFSVLVAILDSGRNGEGKAILRGTLLYMHGRPRYDEI